MATAFNAQERETITGLIKDAARRCAGTIGMKRTTLEQLTHEAGISKSAFYRFYESKEHLFLDIFEEWHTEVYGSAEDVIRNRTDLPIKARISMAVLTACRVMGEGQTMALFAEDLPAMLRRLPPECIAQHYHSDDQHIERLIALSGARLKVPKETASAILRILFMSLFQRADIGDNYEEALEVLVQCTCEQIIEA